MDAARVVAAMAPHELKEGFRKTYAQVKSAWEKSAGKGNSQTAQRGRRDRMKEKFDGLVRAPARRRTFFCRKPSRFWSEA